MEIPNKFAQAFRVLKEAVVEHDSLECGVVVCDIPLNGKVYEIEIKATEKQLSIENNKKLKKL